MRLTRSDVALGAAIVMMALAVIFIPMGAWAQSTATGAIAGSVKDASGGAMAGVTVVAASPALIEKNRTVVTDDHGEYKIVDLRPGIYNVTFSMPGFATIKREELELNTGITLPVDAELKVSSVAETVTVTTATPVVDVENSNPTNVLTNNLLATIPTGAGIPAYTEVTVGATQSGAPDVGGNQGEQNDSVLIHDSRTNNDDSLLDGMSFGNGGSTGGLGQRSWVINKVSVQEVTVSTTGGGAEAGHPGANVNIVPREGGDEFHGAVNATGATPKFQSSNLSSALIARGLTSASGIKEVYDFGAGVGGPIIHGKLWFWIGYGQWNAENYVPGDYYNKTQNTLFYTPDLSRPAYVAIPNYALDMRYDWQASKKNKFSFYQGYVDTSTILGLTGSIAPEAAAIVWNRASFLTQVVWNRMQSDRLLFRVGYTASLAPGRVNAYAPGVTNTDVPIVEQDIGFGYHAYLGQSSTVYGKPKFSEHNGMATAAYVTGSHAFKAGYVWQWTSQGFREDLNVVPGVGPVSYVFNKAAGAPQPVPVSLTEYASPLNFDARSWVEAVYGQDQWTMRRLTLNLGLRYDWERGYTPGRTVAASFFTPAHVFPTVRGIPDWNDISPRVGAAYDLFGNGKSAIKGSIGRYVIGDYTSTTVANSPENAIVTSATRSWTDNNGNYVPDCNLTNVGAQSPSTTGSIDTCGALANNGFGGLSTSTSYSPSVLSGWDVRPYNWQADVQFQQELKPGVGVTVGYYRTWYENFTVTENTAVMPAQFGTFCITGPTDSRLSALTGQTVCGFHDVDPAPNGFGKVQNLVTKASDFGGQSEVYNGFDVTLRARFGHGGFVGGGFATGKVSYNDCAIANNYPNVTATQTNAIASVTSNPTTPTQFCHYVIPWSAGSQVKFQASYPLPWWGLQASLVFQNLPGAPINSSYVATNAQITASLGRSLSSGASTETLTNALYAPFSQFEGKLNQLDLRFTKVFKIKEWMQIKGNFDIYNVTNSSTILADAITYSTTNSYLRPTSLLGPRLFKLGASLTF